MMIKPFADESTPRNYNPDGVLWVSNICDFARMLGITVSEKPLHDVVQDDYLDSDEDEVDSLMGDGND